MYNRTCSTEWLLNVSGNEPPALSLCFLPFLCLSVQPWGFLSWSYDSWVSCLAPWSWIGLGTESWQASPRRLCLMMTSMPDEASGAHPPLQFTFDHNIPVLFLCNKPVLSCQAVCSAMTQPETRQGWALIVRNTHWSKRCMALRVLL